MQKVLKLVSKFTEVAGPKLNISKTEGIWLGQHKEKQQNCNVAGIKWPTEPVRCLGIYIGHDKKECNNLNWDKKLENIKKTCIVAKENTYPFWKGQGYKIITNTTVIISSTFFKHTYWIHKRG